MLEVSVSISDPWDLGEAQGWKPIVAKVLRVVEESGGHALLQVAVPLTYEGIKYQYLVISPRYDGDNLGDLRAGKGVTCALVGISDVQAHSLDALDTSRWRGGLAFIGTLTPIPLTGGESSPPNAPR